MQDGTRLVAVFRDEWEGPYCAERVFKAAQVCKHCGREVGPMTICHDHGFESNNRLSWLQGGL